MQFQMKNRKAEPGYQRMNHHHCILPKREQLHKTINIYAYYPSFLDVYVRYTMTSFIGYFSVS